MTDTATILLVDDQERNLDALEAILENSGYELLRARSADEALLLLLKGEFAAIVCDIRMPGTGGIELAQMIKQRKRTQHIPIVFLSAHSIEEDDLLRGYNVGAVDYLTKPINPEILRLKLGVFVELFRKTRALAEMNQALAAEIAQRERAQEELRLAKEELEQRVQERTAELLTAHRAKDHFLAVLSHELRTPLTPVLATVQEFLHAPNVEPDVREALDLIHRNVELEARLIDDLLDVTRISRGKMELLRSIVQINPIIEHAMRTCDPDFRAKQITVRATLLSQPLLVWGDRARLLQVFWNLLKNAAKFTPEGAAVEIRTAQSDGRVRIEVGDQGIGIDQQQLGTIFNAFEQGNSDVTRRYGGLGLGLSITKALVELHGGTITAESEGLGRGSCFAVELPLATEAAAIQPTAALSPPAAQEAGRPACTVRVLLVEDHPDTCRVMERLLRGEGYTVTSAGCVSAALLALERATISFDILVSDIGLPDGSGLDLMRDVRLRCPAICGIALSGFGMEADRQRSKDAGFSAHLTKPVDLLHLQSTIHRVVARGPDPCTAASGVLPIV
jgi:signal transduction histidine kinase